MLEKLGLSLVVGCCLIILFLVVFWNILPVPREHNWIHHAYPFRNLRHFGYYTLAAAMASLMLLGPSASRTGNRLYLCVLLFTLFIAAMFWSGGRGAMVGLVGGIFVLLLLSPAVNRKNLLWTWGIGIPLGYMVAQIVGIDRANMGVSMVRNEAALDSLNSLSSNRLALWKNAIELILDNPWLGIGPWAFELAPGKTASAITQPHNFVLQSFLAWGLPGGLLILLLFGGIFLAGFRVLWQDRKRDNASGLHYGWYVVFALYSALLVHSLTDGVMFHQPSFAIVVLSAGLVGGGALRDGLKGEESARSTISLAVPIACLSILVGSLHLVNIHTGMQSSPPNPDSWRLKLLKHFPTYYVGEWWLFTWRETNPELAEEWLHWQQQNTRFRSYYFQWEASRFAEEGRLDKAKELLKEAYRYSSLDQRSKIMEQIEELNKMGESAENQ